MYKVLLVEDSAECKIVVERALANAEMDLIAVQTAAEAHRVISEAVADFDVLLLDLVLPDGDGLQILDQHKKMRPHSDTLVYFLTSASELETKIMAFNLGADDYLVKPVSPVELRARLTSRLKKKNQSASEQLISGDLRVDIAAMKSFVTLGSQPAEISLTTKEFRLLVFLMQRPSRVQSRGDLVRSVWGEKIHISERTVDSHICSLRKKMGHVSNYIESIPSVGYKFVGPER